MKNEILYKALLEISTMIDKTIKKLIEIDPNEESDLLLELSDKLYQSKDVIEEYKEENK